MNDFSYPVRKKETQEQLIVTFFLTILIIQLPLSIAFEWTNVEPTHIFFNILAMVGYTFISFFMFAQLVVLVKYLYMDTKGIPALEITSSIFIDRTGIRDFKLSMHEIKFIEIYTKRFYHRYPSLMPLMRIITISGHSRIVNIYYFEQNKAKLKRNLESLGYEVKLLGIKN